MTVLEEIEQAATEVAARVGPAVVGIGRGPGRGAGVVVGDGVVVTNAHNLRGEAVTIRFPGGRQESAQVAGVDVDGDVAVLTVDTSGVTPVEWSESGVRQGAAVFAVTSSAAGESRVSFGLVASVDQSFRGPRGRRITGSLEHTAPLPRGSSGGPVVDGAGRLVGINTNRLGEGFYQALPADAELKARIDGLARGESPTRRRLGVALAPLQAARHLRRAVGLPERDGLLVRHVQEDGPAGLAGVQSGDLLVAAAGRDLTSLDNLYEALDSVDDAGSLALRIVRGVEELDVSVGFAGTTRAEGSA
jgi:serine protease Do